MQHILTIDDEPQIREILRQVLIVGGYRVTDVETAAEAFDIVRRDPPDLIITDLQLEDSDGFELSDQMHRIVPGTPVVLLTGMLFDAATIKRLSEHHVSAYIEKTASLERILSEVRRILKKP